MEIAIIIAFLFIFICTLIVWISKTYNNLQIFTIRLNEAEANIDDILRKRFDLLGKSIDVIKEETKEDDVLNEIIKLRSRKLSNFELDRKLYDGIKEFNNYKEKFPELKGNEIVIKIDIGLSESEAEISAFRKHYNDITTDYNKIVKSFPSNIIASIFKFKARPYFDGKDMSDDDTKDFKL